MHSPIPMAYFFANRKASKGYSEYLIAMKQNAALFEG